MIRLGSCFLVSYINGQLILSKNFHYNSIDETSKQDRVFSKDPILIKKGNVNVFLSQFYLHADVITRET